MNDPGGWVWAGWVREEPVFRPNYCSGCGQISVEPGHRCDPARVEPPYPAKPKSLKDARGTKGEFSLSTVEMCRRDLDDPTHFINRPRGRPIGGA